MPKQNMTDIQQDVFKIIAKTAMVELDKINLESTLQDLGIGSLTTVEIAFAIEDHFNITVPDRDPSLDVNAATVATLVNTVRSLLDAKAAAAAAPTA
jgi:acyl carrier protein